MSSAIASGNATAIAQSSALHSALGSGSAEAVAMANGPEHVLFYCQDLFVCSLRKKYSLLFSLSASPFLWRPHIFCMAS